MTLRRRAFVLVVALAALVAAPLDVTAFDVDGDGTHDFFIREPPRLKLANVGSNCDAWKYNSPLHGRLYVRPPRVWGLRGRERVVWRARFYDVGTGEVRHTGKWIYSTAGLTTPTVFGGGPDAGHGVMVYSNQFWVGSQWYDHLADDGDQIRALVDARWYSVKTRRWTKATLPVKYVIGTFNRTVGSGQAGSVSRASAC
jgi:hypothetical protein